MTNKDKNNLIDGFLLEKLEITDEVVDYYRENPDELDLIIDKEQMHTKLLAFLFGLGLAITIGSRVLAYFFEDIWGKFMNDVVLDVSSELGIAVFGGAVTAYLLEVLQAKQYRENVAYRNAIKARLEQSK
ncbi:MAG: hypothetical protein CSB47_00155 [Proteobacteria bacterium]|nr:MAG: hypothetical protein CSB47_00155 [Pseudomonadota bacterium]